jgi:hypothetical protein
MEVVSAEHRHLDVVRWERVPVDVSATEQPGEAVARDDLTRIVLKTLEDAGEAALELPGEAADMLKVFAGGSSRGRRGGPGG